MQELKKKEVVFGVTNRKRPSWQQFKYLGAVFTEKERWIFDICISLIILAVITIFSYNYFYNTEKVAAIGGEYTEGLVGYPEHINPVLCQTNDVDSDLTSLVFSGMFKYNANEELVPDLVSNYEISEDLKTYTFYLRRDVKWHDGFPLDAEDVLFTIGAIQDENYQSPLEPSLRGIVSEKIDDYSFKLTLKEPFSPFISVLTFGILPQHIWYDIYKISPQNVFLTENNLKPIGTGPYMFDSLVKDKEGNIKSYHLTRFTDYYGSKSKLEKLNFIFYQDIYNAQDALVQKDIDGLFGLPSDSKQEAAKRNKQLIMFGLKMPQYTALFFNQEKSPKVLAKDEVRQALVWGVDRETITKEVLQGEGEAVYTPILPGSLGHNKDVEKYGLDLAKGEQILEEKGWKYNEGNNFREKNGQALEFTIATVDQPEYQKTIEILKSNWEKMGFKINVSVFAAEDIQDQLIKERGYEALLFGAITGTDPDPYTFWHSSQQEHPGLALAIFYQKDLDDLLETARKTTDEEQRRLNYFNFQNVLAEDIPAIFLYRPSYTYAINKRIKGINIKNIPLPANRFAGVTDWYVKADRIKK